MDKLIQQRLVGALILVALSVVFWPIIFVADSKDGPDVTVEVPQAPPVDLTPLPEPDDVGLQRGKSAIAQREADAAERLLPETDAAKDRAAVLSSDEVLVKPSLAEARESLSAPAMDEDGLPIAYSLQVATLAELAGAETLRDELISSGYKAYLKRLRRNDRTLFRVLVGPKYQRSDLEKIKDAIDPAWKVDSMIIRYLP